MKQQQQKQKVADAVEESSPQGPAGKKFGDHSSDEKFNRTGSADSTKKPNKQKGQMSDDLKDSDSDRKGPIIPPR